MKPSPQQQDILDFVENEDGSLNVLARAGCGKCLGKGVPVMKYDGSVVPVESIVVGDRLMGPDSKPRLVTSTNIGFGKLYKITPIKGDSWVCNDVHVITLSGTNREKGKTIDISLNDFLSSQKTTRPDKNWKLFRVPLSFQELEVPYDPYLIGSWLGDGARGSASWTLGYDKEPVLTHLKSLAVAMGNECIVSQDSGQNSWTVRFTAKEIGVNQLRRYIQTLSKERIPDNYLKNSVKVRQGVLAGLLDTDGHQSSPGTFDFVAKHKSFAEDMLFLCRSLGFAAYMSEKSVKLVGWDSPRTYFRVSISGDCSSLPLLRHKATTRKQIKNVLVTGWKAEPIGEGEFFGFTLSGDGRFLLGDFTVTHNTSTLIQVVDLISAPAQVVKRISKGLAPAQVFLGAFNKAIAEELKNRIGQRAGVEVSTMHALGYRLLRNIYTKLESPDSRKVSGLAQKISPFDKKYRGVLASIVSFAKQAGYGVAGCPSISDSDAWDETIEYHGLWEEVPAGISPERVVEDAKKLYNLSIKMVEKEGRIDFDDMLLMPLLAADRLDAKPELYDFVLVDEAQDSNVVRRKLAAMVMKTGGRLIAVGDDRQAIYGFAGASSDSMEQIQKCHGSKVLPLSVTYRCPRAVVEVAQRWVPDITAHESAPEGKTGEIKHWDFWGMDFTPGSDVLLCRNTRPLIGIAQRLRLAGIRCIVEGNNSKSIVALITKWGEVTIGVLRSSLDAYLKEQKAKWTAKKRPEKVEAVQEKVTMVLELAGGMNESLPVRELVRKVESLFGFDTREEDQSVLRLCTIHRSKGREWDRVFWVGPNVYQPSKWAKKDWEIVQEENLMYVAVTRSKRELVTVNVEYKKRSSEDPEWWELPAGAEGAGNTASQGEADGAAEGEWITIEAGQR